MTLVVGGWLDQMILEVFSNLNDSMIMILYVGIFSGRSLNLEESALRGISPRGEILGHSQLQSQEAKGTLCLGPIFIGLQDDWP